MFGHICSNLKWQFRWKENTLFFILVCKYTVKLGLGLYDCLALMLPHPLTHLIQHVFCNFYFYFFWG